MKKVLLTMLGSIVLLGSADGMKRSNSAVWTQEQIDKISDPDMKQLRVDHEDYKKTIRSDFAKATNKAALPDNQVYDKEEMEVLKEANKDIFAGIDELKSLKTKQELADAIDRMVNAGTVPEALDSYVEDNKLNGAFDGLFEKKNNPYTYAEMQDAIDEYKLSEATKDLFNQEQVDAKVDEATKDLFNQEQVDAKVDEATRDLVTREELEKVRTGRQKLVDGNIKRADILLSAGLEYVDGISRLEIQNKAKFDSYFKLSETTSKDVSPKDEEQKIENDDEGKKEIGSMTLGGEKTTKTQAPKTAKVQEQPQKPAPAPDEKTATTKAGKHK